MRAGELGTRIGPLVTRVAKRVSVQSDVGPGGTTYTAHVSTAPRTRRWPWGPRKSLFVPVLVWSALVPCGLIHLYAHRWGMGIVLLVVYFGCAQLLLQGHHVALWGMVGVIGIDLFGGSEAVLAYNRKLRVPHQ